MDIEGPLGSHFVKRSLDICSGRFDPVVHCTCTITPDPGTCYRSKSVCESLCQMGISHDRFRRRDNLKWALGSMKPLSLQFRAIGRGHRDSTASGLVAMGLPLAS